MRTRQQPSTGAGLRQIIALLAAVFMVTLGVVIGTRMSSDAIAVLVGVIAGVVASIPTALLLMAVTRRSEPTYVEEYEDPRQRMPPVIVVTAGNPAQQQLPPYPGYPYQVQASSARRQFRIMGYDDEEDTRLEGAAEPIAWGQGQQRASGP